MVRCRSKARTGRISGWVAGILLLVATGLHSWSEEEITAGARALPADVPEPIRQLFGDSLREFTRLAPRHFPAVFPGQTLYRVARHNPATVIAGPDTFHSCVIERNGAFRHLHQDADAIRALVETAVPVPDVVAAIARVSVFAELRCYTLQLRAMSTAPDTANSPGWGLLAAGRDDGWEVSCVLMTARQTNTCIRYTFHITPAGVITIAGTQPVMSTGGYR